MEVVEFLKSLGITIFGIFIFGGVVYAIRFMFKKMFPDFRYWFKYNILRTKHREQDVIKLLQYYDAKMSVNDVKKMLLLRGKFNLNEVNEFCYIYKQIQKKGGVKNE